MTAEGDLDTQVDGVLKNQHSEAFSKRFNEALDLNGLPPVNRGRIQMVSEMFLVSHAGAGKWVNGLSLPSKKRRREIAQRLGVNYDWLEYGKGERTPKPKEDHANRCALPILGFHEAQFYDQLIPNFTGEKLELDIEASHKAFVLYNVGTAMSGRFPEGTILVFDPMMQPGDGDYVLAKIDRLPECIFRQLYFAETGKYLYPHDPRYKPHKLTFKDKVLAKLIQARMNY